MTLGSKAVAAIVACAALACTPARRAAPLPVPTGPAAVRAEAVAEHAAFFGGAAAERPAGSAAELAASTYLLAHLQRAGYVVRLEPVPVADTLRSTDVEGRAPGGQARLLVAVPYDSGRAQATPQALGLFLELARAARVAAPGHRASFVALGAESSPEQGGLLGSRRLVRLLADANADPFVVLLGAVGPGPAAAGGPGAARLRSEARSQGIELTNAPQAPPSARAFAAAGLEHAWVAGDPAALGRVLLALVAG